MILGEEALVDYDELLVKRPIDVGGEWCNIPKAIEGGLWSHSLIDGHATLDCQKLNQETKYDICSDSHSLLHLESKGFNGLNEIDKGFNLDLWLFDLCDKLCRVYQV